MDEYHSVSTMRSRNRIRQPIPASADLDEEPGNAMPEIEKSRRATRPFPTAIAGVVASLIVVLFVVMGGSLALRGEDLKIHPSRQGVNVPPLLNAPSTRTQSRSAAPITVAYAISLIECTDNHKSGHSSIAGLQDASLVLRHSIHQNSVRNPASGSRYDYEMHALVHEQARGCAPLLEDAGFRVAVRPAPVRREDIRGAWLRNNIQKEVCCGSEEFVKLHAYRIDAPLVVHLDIDFVFRKPMDAVFDVMLGDASEETRKSVEREDPTAAWPRDIEAAIVRDHHSAFPGRKSGFQAGFWVLKPSQRHFDNLLEIIREGNYTGGFAPTNGWGGQGYGGFVGAKAMQGLIAYYYDVHVPGTWIELNNCRYDAVQAVVSKKGKCLNGKEKCEDCRSTQIQDVYSLHYTACRKPWSCIAMGTNDPKNEHKRKYSIPEDIVHMDQCLKSRRIWHEYRRDLEAKLSALTGDGSIQLGQAGGYRKEFFLGHCAEDQAKGYLRLSGTPETMKRIPELYV